MKKYIIFLGLICFSTLAELDIPITITGTGTEGTKVEKTIEEIESSSDALFLVRIDVRVEGELIESSYELPDLGHIWKRTSLQEILQSHRSKIKKVIKASGISDFLMISADGSKLGHNTKSYKVRRSKYSDSDEYYQLRASYNGHIPIYILTPNMPSNVSGLNYITFTEQMYFLINNNIHISSPKKVFTSFPNSLALPDLNIRPILNSLSLDVLNSLDNIHQQTRHTVSSNFSKRPFINVLIHNEIADPILFANNIEASKISSRAQLLRMRSRCMKLFLPFKKQ